MAINLSNRVKAIPPSPTLTISNKAKEMMAQGIDVVNFGVGEPDFNTPDYIKESAKKAIDDNFTRYTANAGIPELRKAICEKFKKDNGLEYSPEQILVSPGAKASIVFALLATINPGDKVLVPAPYWVSYPSQVELAGGQCVYVETLESNNFKITAEQIEDCVKKEGVIKAFFLNSPNNPTGAVYNKEELTKIAAVCVKHNIMVISDEIYEKLIYDGETHISIATISPEIKDLTIIINGVSKVYAMTGWRLGYLAAPLDIAKAAGRVQAHASSNTNSITQKATVAALTEDDGSIEKMRLEFAKRKDFLVDALNKIENVTCIVPHGAFYAVPNISYYIKNNKKGFTTSSEISLYLLENYHIACVAGDSFGLNDIIRFSYANSMENLVKGVERFEKGLKSLI
ncbi:MAG TPA: pyridoxal phosphate-dependent aminotransferase [Candidatus Cloacimonadota bacterium]|jgi:aspartate aminotransferase|nr:pyridoxal phosphate-dependent aminotransferase [Candidatus Cloacimonadales bacterium]HPY96443.1 pyridoxal phosphate-dependent aminotransferase [Candidatus Cloacimonadota bacterium]HQB41856.1 pyridoxal phosphate-dependent aminotransferase [Candidatus Cloacimonadota bacterium]